MGGITPLVLTGASFVKSDMDAKRQNQRAAQDSQLRMNDLARRQAIEAKQRQDALRKASATQRAKFAAQGINAADGSSGAVLDGMHEKAVEDLVDRGAEYDVQRARLENSFAQNQANSLTRRRNATEDFLFGGNGYVQQLKNWD
ncbi:hypothetical protein [Magnetovibrio sp.]|uniref:hypothetical protein n=1 Tax=Magnetovibrio sp. TaxID=2024836 RepID=UPI002F93CA57